MYSRMVAEECHFFLKTSAVAEVSFFFQILTLLGRGRRCPYARARTRACASGLLSYEIAARARAFTQWPSAMAVSREVKVTTRALCAHFPSLTRAIN